MTLVRSLLRAALALLRAAQALLPALALGCGTSISPSSQDLGVSASDLAVRGDLSGMSLVDLSLPSSTDLTPSVIGSCLPLNQYCGYGGNFCVQNWANAQIPANWCTPGKDVDIYLPTGPCTGGYRVVTLGGANFLDNKQLFYSMTGDGALVAIVSISEGPTYLCDAGDTSYANLMYNGCSYGPSAVCVNGVIQ